MKSISIKPRNSGFGSASWFVSHPDDTTSLSRRCDKTTFPSRILSFVPRFYTDLRFWIVKSRMAGTPLTGRNVTTMNCTVKLEPKTCKTCFATWLQHELNSDVSRFTTYESRLFLKNICSSIPGQFLQAGRFERNNVLGRKVLLGKTV